MENIVKFCKTNYCNGSDSIKEKAQNNPNLLVLEADCLGNCGQCYLETFAVVNEKPIAISSYDELLDGVEQYPQVK